MKLLFLPGASGNRQFWDPVKAELDHFGDATTLGWPGLGGVPEDPNVTHFDHLVDLVRRELREPAHLIAQSMGTVVALRTALAAPQFVASLVLVATAGGIDVQRLGATDWRDGAPAWHPKNAPRYFFDETSDFSREIQTITAQTLLLCGDEDPLSPVAVSERLLTLLPNARLSIVTGGDHDLAHVHAHDVAARISEHLERLARR